MTPTQSTTNAKVSEMQAAVPSAGTRVLALLLSEATSLVRPKSKTTHQRTSLVYPWESASDQGLDNDRTNGPTDTRNRHTLPIEPFTKAEYYLPASLSD